MQKSAGIFIINQNNELLICHPTLHQELGHWSIPKGKIELGETNIEAAVRETKEETNITVNDIDKLIELQSELYKSKKKRLFPYLLKDFKLDNNAIIECISFTEYKGKTIPENDKFLWINIDDPRLFVLLHECQIRYIQQIKKLLN